MSANDAAAAGDGQPERGLVRGLGLVDATTLIVGSVIGSGIFVAPSIMAGYVEGPALLVGLWVVGGLLTLFGALAYAELAAALPRAGGPYVFLCESFGRASGFLYGWTFLLAINTGLVAAVAVAFAKYLGVFVPGLGENTRLLGEGRLSLSTAQVVALAAIAVLTWLNVTGLRTGARVQNLFTTLKVGAVLLLLALAVALRKGSLGHFEGEALRLGPEGLKLGLLAALAVAMSKALFAYDCWYYAAFVAEEVREPERNLPRALLYGTLGVTLVYGGLVAFYVYMVPVGQMYAVADNRIAAEAAQRLLGAGGLVFVTLAILVSTFGCVNGLILSGARLVFAMARDGLFFRRIADVHASYRTPANALVAQGVVAGALTLSGTYSDLLTLTAFSSLLFNVLTIAGLFVLRVRRPDLPRPYRAWGYPVLPALYIAVSLFFLVYILIGDPRNSGLGLVITLLGVPVYLAWHRRGAAQTAVSSTSLRT